jgi:hypothetical protein
MPQELIKGFSKMLKVSIRIFNTNERNHLKMVLHGLESRFKNRFKIVDSKDANAIIVSSEEPGCDLMLANKKIISILYGDKNPENFPWFIQKPGRIIDIAPIIKNLVEKFSSTVKDENIKKTSENKDFIIPELSNVLIKIKSGTDSLEIKIPGYQTIYYSSQNLLIYLQGANLKKNPPSTALKRFLDCDPKLISCKKTSDSDIKNTINNTGHHPFPIDSLIWISSLYLADVNTNAYENGFKLKKWPNFTILACEHWHIKACAIMMKGSVNALQLSQIMGISLEDAISFFSACLSLDLFDSTDKVNQKTSDPILIKPKKQDFIVRKLLHRVFGS